MSESRVQICLNCSSTNYKDLNGKCYRCGYSLHEPTYTLAQVKEIIEEIASRVGLFADEAVKILDEGVLDEADELLIEAVQGFIGILKTITNIIRTTEIGG